MSNLLKLEPKPGRVPPSDLDAEAAVLSAALLDPGVVPTVRGILPTGEYFYADANARIYGAILEISTRGQPVDIVTVATLLRDKGRLDQIGGAPYLAQLSDATPAVAHVAAHASVIREKWRLRQLISSCQKFAAEGYGDTGELQGFLERASTTLRAIAEDTTSASEKNKSASSCAEVLAEWQQSGPLVHEATGIERLDELTGGGPVYGTRWYLAGAPDAGKTALLVQIAHIYLIRGVAVGLLAVDEEAGDIVTRFAQRAGYSRRHCEIRDHSVMAGVGHELGKLPLRLYDDRWTIEDAAVDLAAFAQRRAQEDPGSHPHGPRAMLGIDSIQTVRCAADAVATSAGREQSEVSAVTARVRAVRTMASKHRLITMATTELGRGAYRSSDPSQQISTLAAGKWSGAIEYSARVLIGLRSVADEPDLVELELAKNKHGPRDEKIHLRIDRRSQLLSPIVYDAPPKATAADRDAKAKEKVTADAPLVARMIASKPGIIVRELRSAMKAAHGFGVERVNAAVDRLGAAVVKGVPGKNGSIPMSLDEGRLPDDVRTAFEVSK